MSTVGGIRVIRPVEVVMPSPQPICPAGDFGSAAPYMYSARLLIAPPA
ncbi:Uncharacterised protein [Mycobacteroides abscessus subsp. abscessus]|nr:Uncharacterised protein [Mycobacteroides abscessus subsp. abscessus]